MDDVQDLVIEYSETGAVIKCWNCGFEWSIFPVWDWVQSVRCLKCGMYNRKQIDFIRSHSQDEGRDD